MKVNSVIVTYNRLALLKECLAAVEAQTYPQHRIIVVDNCSTDGTYYKITGCKDNKTDTDTFWCAVPKTIDCNALGYQRSSGSCGSLSKIACPFDASKFACIDFN